MKKVIVFIHSIVSIIAFSQEISYKGCLETKENLEGDYFISFRNIDTDISYSEITDEANCFYFPQLPIGKYERCIHWFEHAQCDTLFVDKNTEDNIAFVLEENILAELIIDARKPFIQNKLGVLIVNVENNPIMNTASVLDAIVKSPGVTYNASNKEIRLKGKSGILIQIDGESMLLGQ